MNKNYSFQSRFGLIKSIPVGTPMDKMVEELDTHESAEDAYHDVWGFSTNPDRRLVEEGGYIIHRMFAQNSKSEVVRFN